MTTQKWMDVDPFGGAHEDFYESVKMEIEPIETTKINPEKGERKDEDDNEEEGEREEDDEEGKREEDDEEGKDEPPQQQQGVDNKIGDWQFCALTEADWGIPDPINDKFCYWCEYGPSEEQMRAPHVVHMIELFALIGQLPMRRVCGLIQKLYDERFRRFSRSEEIRNKPWTLFSIRNHIRYHESLSPEVELRLMGVELKAICNTMEDFEMCARHSVTGQKRINRDEVNLYLKIVKQRAMLQQRLSSL